MDDLTTTQRLIVTLMTAGAFLLIAAISAVIRATVRNDDPRPEGRAER